MYPGCLAHVVSGMFYSVIANRRQPDQDGGWGGGVKCLRLHRAFFAALLASGSSLRCCGGREQKQGEGGDVSFKIQ